MRNRVNSVEGNVSYAPTWFLVISGSLRMDVDAWLD
jgi:hypothetical protein